MIWVTGSGGMLGRMVVSLLRERNIPFVESDSNVDIRDKKAVDSFGSGTNIRWVVNCAAYTAVDAAEDDRDQAFSINRDGVRVLAEFCAEKRARLVHFSTDYVFDGTASEPYAEDAPAAPLSVYGKTKLLGEQVTREADPDHLIVRLAWLYSPAHGNFVRTILRRARQKDALRIVSDQTGSPTFTEDVVRQVLALINDGASGTYHCADTGHATWYEYGCNVVRAAGLNIPVIPIQTVDYPAPAVRPVFSVLADRNLDLEQINLMRPWQEALADCISRYIETLLHD